MTMLATALMTLLDIGLTVSTLPVIALGVGIGVDYGIYILTNMTQPLRAGVPLRQAYYQALKSTGSAVLFTGSDFELSASVPGYSRP